MSDFIVGPNRCGSCGGEYGDHTKTCPNRAPSKGKAISPKKNPQDATRTVQGKRDRGQDARVKDLERRVRAIEKFICAEKSGNGVRGRTS